MAVLLKWHQVKMEKGAKVPGKRCVWKEIFEEGRLPPSYKKWTEEDEERLIATTFRINHTCATVIS